jgi:hypothetical protein
MNNNNNSYYYKLKNIAIAMATARLSNSTNGMTTKEINKLRAKTVKRMFDLGYRPEFSHDNLIIINKHNKKYNFIDQDLLDAILREYNINSNSYKKTLEMLRDAVADWRLEMNSPSYTIDEVAKGIANTIKSGSRPDVYSVDILNLLNEYNLRHNLIEADLLLKVNYYMNNNSNHVNNFLNSAVRNYQTEESDEQAGGKKKKKKSASKKKSVTKKKSTKSKKGGAKKKKTTKKSKKTAKKKTTKKSKRTVKRGGAKRKVAKRTKKVAKRSVAKKSVSRRSGRKH